MPKEYFTLKLLFRSYQTRGFTRQKLTVSSRNQACLNHSTHSGSFNRTITVVIASGYAVLQKNQLKERTISRRLRKTIKLKLSNRSKAFVYWLSIDHNQVAEDIMFSGVVGFVCINIEQATNSKEQCQRMIAACHTVGSKPTHSQD